MALHGASSAASVIIIIGDFEKKSMLFLDFSRKNIYNIVK